MYKGKSIGVVIPAFNESRLVGKTLDSVPSYVDRIYAVDDASTDATQSIMSEHSKRDPRIRLLSREVNGGVGAAVVLGYKKALNDGIDISAVMAGDGQMDPQFLLTLLNPIIEGKAEYTKGDRLFGSSHKGQMSSWRYFGNVVLSYLNKIASGYWNIDDPQNGYVAITAGALGKLDLDGIYRGYAFENDMLVKLNVHNVTVLDVPIPAQYGEEESKITYGSFIVRTSAFFLRAFFWRIWNKYLSGKGKGEPRSRRLHSATSWSPAANPNEGTVDSAFDTQMHVPISAMTPNEPVVENDSADQHTGDAEEQNTENKWTK